MAGRIPEKRKNIREQEREAGRGGRRGKEAGQGGRRGKGTGRGRLLVPAAVIILILAAVGGFAAWYLFGNGTGLPAGAKLPEYVTVDLISRANPSRTGKKLEGVNDIVIHYVGNPGTTAAQNRRYYGNLNSDVSSHFIVGLDGEVIMCIPLNEKSSATNDRNRDTISIEVCHPDETGKFTDAGYDTVVRLTAWLLDTFGLPDDHVIRHYDVTGKECPRYYVRNEEAWRGLLADVAAARRH